MTRPKPPGGLPLNRRMLLTGAASAVGVGWACAPRAADVANLIIATPKLNQLGFLPEQPKKFCLSVTPGDAAPRPFRVEDERGGVVLQGQLEPRAYDLTATAAEHVRSGDFTALDRPGRYRVRVGDQVSRVFEIGASIYAPLLSDAGRSFYIIRANAALDDPVTGLKHKPSHLTDAALVVDGRPRDLTGGWYNAGDYGKWTHMAAISSSEMMWLYELRPERAHALSLQIPQTYAALPDLLQQARWGLEWLLKMQNPDGSVLHKVDTEPEFAWGLLPEDDPHPRAARGRSSIDAGVFVGAVAQAARVFARADPAFAQRCRAAAQKSWAWLERNPNVPHQDPYYADPDPRQEHLWALCEMARLTGDPALRARAADETAALGVYPFFWPGPQLLGVMSLAHTDARAKAAAVRAIADAAAQVRSMVLADPYGYSARPELYTWGSVELALNAAVTCLFAAELNSGAEPRDTAQRLLDYVLGCNALDLSFVTGHGSRAVKHPYNWTYRTQQRLMPGWAGGGPNGNPSGADPLLQAVQARGTPPAKCFVDACEPNGSWASNEGQTTEAAALTLAVGLYSL